MPTTSVRIDENLEMKLSVLAKETNRSKSWIIIQALHEYLEKGVEQRIRWEETRRALESASSTKVVPAEDVHSWLQSWGSAQELPTPRARE